MASPFANFALTDPVAAQQVVQLAQILQAEKAAAGNNRVNTLQAITQGNISRDNAAQQRAYSQAQLAQRDREAQVYQAQRKAEMDQSQRQFEATDAYRKSALDQNRALKEADLKFAVEDAQRATLENNELEVLTALEDQIKRGNPPTETEFNLSTVDMTPRRKAALNQLRLDTISELNRQADVAEKIAAKWTAKLTGLKPEQTRERDTVLAEFEKSKDKNFVEMDPETGSFMSLLKRPRTDPAPTAAAPTVSALQQRLIDTRNKVRALIGGAPVPGGTPTPVPPPTDAESYFAVPFPMY